MVLLGVPCQAAAHWVLLLIIQNVVRKPQANTKQLAEVVAGAADAAIGADAAIANQTPWRKYRSRDAFAGVHHTCADASGHGA